MRRTGASFRLPLALAVAATPAAAQGEAETPPPAGAPFRLEEPYPSPFRSTVRIPFVLSDSAFAGGGGVGVTMRVFNLLHQVVAVPTALDHPDGAGRPLDGLAYPGPGRYLAFWDGRDGSGRRVAPGPYFVQLLVGGESEIRKLLVSR